MVLSTYFLAAIVACNSLASATYTQSSNATCTTRTQRKAWHKMEDTEKQAYIDAELCLINTPGSLGLDGAQTLFDELQYCHVWQSNVIHYSGQFLPWHRYFMLAHELMLQSQCNYTGGQPYWQEELDTHNNSLQMSSSPVFSPLLGFGGNGSGDLNCVPDGPFSNMTNHLGPGYNISDTCLSRNFTPAQFSKGNQTYIDTCNAIDNYEEAYWCWKTNPHSNAHLGVDGTMEDPLSSPGDPLFYLHHTNLDRLWANWQAANATGSRIYEIGGISIPPQWWLTKNGMTAVTQAQIDGFNDPVYNRTSLSHNLIMEGIIPNATVGDVMDISSNFLCYEYV